MNKTNKQEKIRLNIVYCQTPVPVLRLYFDFALPRHKNMNNEHTRKNAKEI